MEFRHESVLLGEVIEYLNIRPDGIYLDGTLGGGGHSFRIAAALDKGGLLLGIDQDMDALRAAERHLCVYKDRVRLFHRNYEEFETVMEEAGVTGLDGILLDLGVSSYQLDNPERGFSYSKDAPLDMRMDQSASLTAEEIINEWSWEDLTRILRDYGEERFADRIADRILEERGKKRITRTSELEAIVRSSIPMRMQERGGNPCKRTFQAVRIACNRELEVLQNSLDRMIDRLNPGGRLAVITFHSLEDRIVKTCFRTAQDPCICPPDFPVCTCGRKSRGRVVTRKAVLPGESELEENKRSASAKLRVFEKTTE